MLLESYPYLGLSLVLLAICLLGLLIYHEHRLPMLLSALVAAPFALWSPTFVPEYWQPERVACFLAGPEDVVFSFAVGGLTWMLATWPLRDRIILAVTPGRIVNRLLLCLLPSAAVTTLFWLYQVPVMTAVLLGMAALGLLALYLRRILWPIAIWGAAGFCLLYSAILKASFTVWPDFPGQWSTEQLWGFTVIGLPAEELAWACGLGAVWPLLIAYALDARLKPST